MGDGWSNAILGEEAREDGYRRGYAAALEDAARVCEEMDEHYAPDTVLLGRAAERIRALKDG